MAESRPPAELLFDAPLPELPGGTMLVAFSGWMDGGDVSTGTVRRLIEHLGAHRVARVDHEPFYILNIPGNMEIAALFRPHCVTRKGVLQHIELPENEFYVSPAEKLVLFVGEEPNMRWHTFSECMLSVARRTQVARVLFIGSFAGSVPHTREPRLYASISSAAMQPMLQRYAVRPSTYQGPGSFATYLLSRAPSAGLEMATLVAEIPAYVEGPNPMSIEAVTRRLASMLELPMDLAELRGASDAWEAQISQAIADNPELADKIRQLEAEYDQDLVEVHENDPWLAEDPPDEDEEPASVGPNLLREEDVDDDEDLDEEEEDDEDEEPR